MLPGGMPGPGGGVVSQHALRQTPPVNRMTDRCKNITCLEGSVAILSANRSADVTPE